MTAQERTGTPENDFRKLDDIFPDNRQKNAHRGSWRGNHSRSGARHDRGFPGSEKSEALRADLSDFISAS